MKLLSVNSEMFSTSGRRLKRTNVNLFKSLLLLLFCFNLSFVFAQDEKSERGNKIQDGDDYKAFTLGAHLKNMHLWHGFVVQDSPIFATNLEYNSKNSKFTFGFWGGASFSGTDVWNPIQEEYVNANYREFSIYAVYRFSDKFFMEAVTHNNFTGVSERGDKLRYWSYDKTQGYNFVDINFGYNITPNTLLYLATIVGGGSGDFEVQENGDLEDSWTHYFEVRSKVWGDDDLNLSVFAGGAWSFITDKTFYTESAGNVINVGAALAKKIKIKDFKLPVEVTAMWNPEKEITVLQLDITLF